MSLWATASAGGSRFGMSGRYKQEKSVAMEAPLGVGVHYLWHPGTTDQFSRVWTVRCSGAAGGRHHGRPSHDVAAGWLEEIERTFGSYSSPHDSKRRTWAWSVRWKWRGQPSCIFALGAPAESGHP